MVDKHVAIALDQVDTDSLNVSTLLPMAFLATLVAGFIHRSLRKIVRLFELA